MVYLCSARFHNWPTGTRLSSSKTPLSIGASYPPVSCTQVFPPQYLEQEAPG